MTSRGLSGVVAAVCLFVELDWCYLKSHALWDCRCQVCLAAQCWVGVSLFCGWNAHSLSASYVIPVTADISIIRVLCKDLIIEYVCMYIFKHALHVSRSASYGMFWKAKKEIALKRLLIETSVSNNLRWPSPPSEILGMPGTAFLVLFIRASKMLSTPSSVCSCLSGPQRGCSGFRGSSLLPDCPLIKCGCSALQPKSPWCLLPLHDSLIRPNTIRYNFSRSSVPEAAWEESSPAVFWDHLAVSLSVS